MAISTYIVSDITSAISKAKISSNSALPNYTSVVPKVPHVFNRNLRILQPKEKVTFSADLVNLAGMSGSHTSGDVENFRKFDYDLVVAYVEGSTEQQSFVIAEQGDRGYFIRYQDTVLQDEAKTYRFTVLTDSNPEVQVLVTEDNTYFIDTYNYTEQISDYLYGVAKTKLPFSFAVKRVYLDDDELESVFEITPNRVLTDLEESKLKKINYAYSCRGDSNSNLRVFDIVDYEQDSFISDGTTSLSNLKSLLLATNRETPFSMLVGTLPLYKGVLLNSEVVGKSTAAELMTDVVGTANLQTYSCERAVQKFSVLTTLGLSSSAYITVFKEGDIDTQVGSYNINAPHIQAALMDIGILCITESKDGLTNLYLKHVLDSNRTSYYVKITDTSVKESFTEGGLKAFPFESTTTTANYSLAPVYDTVVEAKPSKLKIDESVSSNLEVSVDSNTTQVLHNTTSSFLSNRRSKYLEDVQTVLYKHGIQSFIDYEAKVLNISKKAVSHKNIKVTSDKPNLESESYNCVLVDNNSFSIAANPVYQNNSYMELYNKTHTSHVVLDKTKITSLTIKPFSRVETGSEVSEQSTVLITEANYLENSLANTTLINIKPLYKDGALTNLVEITAQGGVVKDHKVINVLFKVNPEAVVTSPLVDYTYATPALKTPSQNPYTTPPSSYRSGYTYLSPKTPSQSVITFKLKSDEDTYTVRIRDVANNLLETVSIGRSTTNTNYLNVTCVGDVFTLTLKSTTPDTVYSASVNRTYIEDISSTTELLFIEQFAFFKVGRTL